MNNEYKVFVRGLKVNSENRKEREEHAKLLAEHFGKCGTVLDVFVKNDFAFVKFGTEDERSAALKLNGGNFGEFKIEVALPRDQFPNNMNRPRRDFNKKWFKTDDSKSEVKNWSKK